MIKIVGLVMQFFFFWQAVDHPYLVVYSSSGGANANLNDDNKKEHECGLCHEPAEDNVVSVSINFFVQESVRFLYCLM